MAKFVCPFCIRKYNTNKVLYVCPDCGESTPKSKKPIKCKKDGCGGLAAQRKCPICGQEIPNMALTTINLPFCIVGAFNSGKTNYITVMLHELYKGSSIRLALGAQNKETRDHQNENCKRIYEIRPKLFGGGVKKRIPQIWYIKNLSRKRK